MVKYRIQLRNVQNVAASKTALIDCPTGQRYHWIGLVHGYAAGTNTIAGAYANISEIRVLVNDRVQRTVSGAQLRDKNILNGNSSQMVGAVTAMLSGFDAVAGQVPNTAPGVVIPIFFGEPWMADEATQDALAWPTNLWSSMQVQVDLGAASTPTLAAFAVVDDLTVTKEPSIVKYIRGSIPASGTSFDFTLSERRDLLRAIHIYQDSGGSNTPSEVDLRKDGKILHELSYAANQGLLVGYQMTPNASGRTAGIYDLVLDHDGLLVSAVDLSQGTAPTVTVKAASTMSGTTTYILERLGPRE